MKKIILLLILLIPIMLFGGTKTILDFTELETAASNDYTVIEDVSSGHTRKILISNLVAAYLQANGVDSINVVKFVVDTVYADTVYIVTSIGFDSQTSTINGIQVGNLLDATIDDTVSGEWTFSDTCTIGGVSSQNLLDKTADETISGKYTYSDTLNVTRVEVTGYLNVPTDSLKINSVAITKSAAEINGAVDSVSVFSARSLANSDSVTAHRIDINTNVDSVTAISSRSLSNRDTLDTYIDGITFSKDLYDTGVTKDEFDKLDGLTSSADEMNILDGVTITHKIKFQESGFSTLNEVSAGTTNLTGYCGGNYAIASSGGAVTINLPEASGLATMFLNFYATNTDSLISIVAQGDDGFYIITGDSTYVSSGKIYLRKAGASVLITPTSSDTWAIIGGGHDVDLD